jgi:hypothetical protein
MSNTNPIEISTNYGVDTKEDYGDSDRLDPDDARQFIYDLIGTMQTRSWEECQKPDTDIERGQNMSSEAKQLYGDTWTFLYGISSGMALMNSEHEKEIDWDNGEEIDHGIAGDDSWQEHYDQYGYGPYGRGLKIGKRLAFYEDRDFSFSADSPSASEKESEESGFTIKSYD